MKISVPENNVKMEVDALDLTGVPAFMGTPADTVKLIIELDLVIGNANTGYC